MIKTHAFPRPRAVTFPEAFSRANQELALRQAMGCMSIRAKPGPISYPLGFAIGTFAAHVGHVAGPVIAPGLPPLLVACLVTLLLVAGCLALWRRRSRPILYLAAIGAAAGLVLAPVLLGPGAGRFLAQAGMMSGL